MTIHNSILTGFNPDPSIVRVGDDYYIATSTFEWFPGVQIHHSRDLVHWRLLTRPLNRASQLNMLGDPDSCGIWAPCLTHADGVFYLVYTDVKRYGRASQPGAGGATFRDFHNYLVTSPRIGEDFVGWKPRDGGDDRTLGLVDFSIFPHVDHPMLPENTMAAAERWAAGVAGPSYAIDDETAIKVSDGTAEVVSEGNWRRFPA